MHVIHKIPNLVLSLFGAVLLWTTWAPSQLSFLLPFGFVPWIVLVLKLREDGRIHLAKWWLLLGILLWNVLCTWWVSYADFMGSIMMIGANTLLMILPWGLFTFGLRRLRLELAFLVLIGGWLSFEFMHYNWESHFPWLNLGNGFARSVWLIQWYEYTGVLGGSLWVLLVSVVFASALYLRKWSWWKLGTYLIPVLISLLVFFTYQENGITKKAVIVQPCLDPYDEKFEWNPLDITSMMMDMVSNPKYDSADILVLPETAIPGYVDEPHFKLTKKAQLVANMLENRKELAVLSGVETYDFIYADKQPTPAARMQQEGIYYEKYNTAALMQRHSQPQFYHKSKLVPGPETVPFIGVFKALEKIEIELPGRAGLLGVSDTPVVFTTKSGIHVAPLICYESIFGEYTGKFVTRGANLLAIITNDAWWDTTNGFRQHLYYGALRAIESRRDIVRSANTGISCIVNQKGELVVHSNWWKREVISGEVHLNDTVTFYSKHGDYLGWFALILLTLGLLSAVFYKYLPTVRYH